MTADDTWGVYMLDSIAMEAVAEALLGMISNLSLLPSLAAT